MRRQRRYLPLYQLTVVLRFFTLAVPDGIELKFEQCLQIRPCLRCAHIHGFRPNNGCLEKWIKVGSVSSIAQLGGALMGRFVAAQQFCSTITDFKESVVWISRRAQERGYTFTTLFNTKDVCTTLVVVMLVLLRCRLTYGDIPYFSNTDTS